MRVNSTRPAAVAGTWYPAIPGALARDVDGYLAAVDPGAIPRGRLDAVIAPHAGLMFSGPVGAYAYKAAAVNGPFAAVILIGPSHFVAFDGVALYPSGAFASPLGPAPIDERLGQALLDASPVIHAMPAAHGREHSLEMQLPFIRRLLPDTAIVPLLMGHQSRETIEGLAQALSKVAAENGAAEYAEYADKKILLVASTDLSHYFDAPTAEGLDARVAECVAENDPERLLELFEEYPEGERGRYVACGGGPAISVMLAARARGARHGRALKYMHSGEISGDNSGVVGYLQAHWGPSMTFTEAQQRALVEVARSAVIGAIAGAPAPAPRDEDLQALPEASGAFVTLKRDGQLRGCIGTLECRRPLAEEIARVAVSAAREDPRFDALRPEELDGLDVEVSILGPLEEIDPRDPAAIVIGRHGLVVEQGHRRGLLLPQVATEWGWDREQFLSHTCTKAGLPADGWQRGAKVYRFAADVFGD